MNNKIFYFTDIDDTIIQTKRKLDNNKEYIPYACKKDGSESSYISEGMNIYIENLITNKNIVVIPVTARNLDSYNRCNISTKVSYAVLNFSAIILINNKEDLVWKSYITKKFNNLAVTIHDIISKINTTNISKYRIKSIDNYYISLYSVDSDNIQEIKSLINNLIKNNDEYYMYENGRSFAIIPKFLNKKYAVQYLINKYNPLLTIGVGDHNTDLPFMLETDLVCIPSNSSIINKVK